MRGEVHILVNCPINTFLREKQHSALSDKLSQHFRSNREVCHSLAKLFTYIYSTFSTIAPMTYIKALKKVHDCLFNLKYDVCNFWLNGPLGLLHCGSLRRNILHDAQSICAPTTPRRKSDAWSRTSTKKYNSESVWQELSTKRIFNKTLRKAKSFQIIPN